MEDMIILLDEGEMPVIKKSLPVSKCLKETNTILEAIQFLQKRKMEIAPVFSTKGDFVGVISYKDIATFFIIPRITKNTKLSSCSKYLIKGNIDTVNKDTPLKKIFPLYKEGKLILVEDSGKVCAIYCGNK